MRYKKIKRWVIGLGVAFFSVLSFTVIYISGRPTEVREAVGFDYQTSRKISLEGVSGFDSQVVLSLDPSEPKVKSGDVFSLLIEANIGDTAVLGYDLHLYFDPEILEVIDVFPGSSGPQIVSRKVNATAGSLAFSAVFPPDDPQVENGTLVNISFLAKKETGGNSALVELLPRTNVVGFRDTGNIVGSLNGAKVTVSSRI
jgi:hypothetical protein